MTNLEKFIELKKSELQAIASQFTAGDSEAQALEVVSLVVKQATSSLHALLAEIEKEAVKIPEGYKLKFAPAVSRQQLNSALDSVKQDILALLHPSEPKEE